MIGHMSTAGVAAAVTSANAAAPGVIVLRGRLRLAECGEG